MLTPRHSRYAAASIADYYFFTCRLFADAATLLLTPSLVTASMPADAAFLLMLPLCYFADATAADYYDIAAGR